MKKVPVLMAILGGVACQTGFSQGYEVTSDTTEQAFFEWPEGKKMALSLTFDDARLTQIDKGIPLLDQYGVKGTFYVSPNSLLQRTARWRKAVENGHDIGNHSMVHPCTVNFDFAKNKALEDYTLDKMREELITANRLIRDSLGVEAVSFAYPCGQKFVGRGTNTRSYIPVVASLFESGRGWMDEGANDPFFCDMAQLTGMEMDGKSFEQVRKLIETAKGKGQWLILAGHEMNDEGSQTTRLSMLRALCQYAADPSNEIWIDHVHHIASYIKEKRGERAHEPQPAYKNPLFPVRQRVEDLLSKMTLEEKVGQMNIPCVYKKRIGWGLDSGDLSIHKKLTQEERQIQMEGCRKFARGDHNTQIGPGGGFFTLADRIIYEGTRRQAEFFNELQDIAVNESRLGIPLLQIEEGTHGFMCAGGTVFPEGLAIGSTWNMDLVGKVYGAVAREGRATGAHMLCTLVIEPNRDPRLGRNQEGYAEDPWLCSRIAETIVTSMQGFDVSGKDKVVAALCHYPGQSEPLGGLERGAMEISERKLREVFLPPWEAGIKKCGALAVMATYPAIDEETVHSSEYLLKKVLRDELGFEGIVLSEGRGISTILDEHMTKSQKEAGQIAVNAGVDVGISMEDAYLGPLVKSVGEGVVSEKAIDDAVRHILTVKFRLGLFEDPYVHPRHAESVVHSPEHVQLALETAREGIVLLKNEKDFLPLDKNIRSVAVIGPLADAGDDQIGDYIPHHIPQELVTVLKGIKSKVSPGTKINYVKGCDVIGGELDDIAKAKAAAKNADVAVVVIGEKGDETNGEGRDVASLDLTGLQEQLLQSVHSTGTPTVVVLINGRPLSVRWAAEHVPAIVEAWMCGEQGGNA
ncbi:MAG: glycoside hydrolase family 3 N-terminal domain-containing protein, partial [Mangrovibacterium sp.]|nr:glycoside hydrolase family 3 N-terminal domain-containing protein [Mangrovibacterium sp.]